MYVETAELSVWRNYPINCTSADIIRFNREELKKMVLRYMLSGSDLAESKVVQSKKKPVRGKEKRVSSTTKKFSISVKGLGLWFLLFVVVVIWGSLHKSVTGRNLPIWYYLTANKSMVTGIVCNSQNRTAIVRGRVVHEGEVVAGYKVVKIYKDKVEFEKNGKTIVKHLNK
jgi:hypothetical protein